MTLGLVVRSDPWLASLKTVSWITLDFGDGAKFFKDSLNNFSNCYLFILNSLLKSLVFYRYSWLLENVVVVSTQWIDPILGWSKNFSHEFQSRIPVPDRVPDPKPFFLVVGMSANQHSCFTTPHEYCIGRTIVLLIYYHTLFALCICSIHFVQDLLSVD